MKKIVCGFVFTIFTLAGTLAQEIHNAISFDIATNIHGAFIDGWGFGVGYERAISEKIALQVFINGVGNETVSPYDDISNGATQIFSIGGGIHFRYYPFGKTVSGFFLNFGVEYTYETREYWWKAETRYFTIFPKLGYKFIFGKEGGFFIEPALMFPIPIGTLNLPYRDDIIEIPEAPGVIYGGFGLCIGWAF
ncbi:hypothetical protein FACS1894102_0950 [Spirochaetia bacterium]|nr:hypothetical protein FACS1894102_0950 [Spirochaetia bacterium]